MNKTKQLVLTAFFIALGLVLPMAFHAVPNSGSVLLPMHIPVLLCGLTLGPVSGLIAGMVTPVLSSIMTSMPPAAILPGMFFELAAYGFTGGLLIRLIKTKKEIVNLYLALIGAMLAGRILSGILNALIFRAGAYSLEVWLAAGFITALPGIVIQLLLLPAIVLALRKARLI